jgi:hypothetical protein
MVLGPIPSTQAITRFNVRKLLEIRTFKEFKCYDNLYNNLLMFVRDSNFNIKENQTLDKQFQFGI